MDQKKIKWEQIELLLVIHLFCPPPKKRSFNQRKKWGKWNHLFIKWKDYLRI